MSLLWQSALDTFQGSGTWVPMPHQVPPDPRYATWLLCGGRGIGKTDAGTHEFDRLMSAQPDTRGRIIAPTLGDARESCVLGVSGIQVHNPAVRWSSQSGVLLWPNGSRARIFGAHDLDDVDRLRAGGNSALDLYEELAAWRCLDEAWDQAAMGLRIGVPRRIITTTPRPKPLILALLDHPKAPPRRASIRNGLVVTHATTEQNRHLSAEVRASLTAAYAGTRLARQELLGEIVLDVEGALWTQEVLDAGRVTDIPRVLAIVDNRRIMVSALTRVVVAVDPAATNTEASDETGIVAAGIGPDRHAYVVADNSGRYSPDGWGSRAVACAVQWEADELVYETNMGGDMAKAVLTQAVLAHNREQPARAWRGLIVGVHASKGKQVRAQPVAMLYEQQRVHHCGTFGKLESQLTEWVPGESSPDRLDALCHGLTRLMLQAQTGRLSFHG